MLPPIVTLLDRTVTMSDTPPMDKTLSRVTETAKARARAERELARADHAFRSAVLAAHKQGASLRAIRDASGGLLSHEGVRRTVAAAARREGGK
jgi:hypothetical protein